MSRENNIQKTIKCWGRVLLIGVALSTFSSWASADEGKEHGHSESEKEKTPHGHRAPHGGLVSHAGKYDAELLIKDKERVLICLTLDGKPMPAADKEAKLFVQFPDNRNQSVPLTPVVFENAPCLEGQVGIKEAGPFKAIVSLTLDGKRQNLRFQSVDPH